MLRAPPAQLIKVPGSAPRSGDEYEAHTGQLREVLGAIRAVVEAAGGLVVYEGQTLVPGMGSGESKRFDARFPDGFDGLAVFQTDSVDALAALRESERSLRSRGPHYSIPHHPLLKPYRHCFRPFVAPFRFCQSVRPLNLCRRLLRALCLNRQHPPAFLRPIIPCSRPSRSSRCFLSCLAPSLRLLPAACTPRIPFPPPLCASLTAPPRRPAATRRPSPAVRRRTRSPSGASAT